MMSKGEAEFKMDARIRVLMITCEWPAAGMSRTAHFIKRQAEFLKAAGVELDVFVFRGAKNPVNYIKAWARLRRRLRRGSYDLIHAQFGQSGILTWPRRLPLVVTFRGSDLLGTVSDHNGRYMKASVIHQWLSRRVARRADAVVVVSEHMKSHLDDGSGAHVIPSGIDLELFRPVPKQDARLRLNLPQDERLVLFVGRPTQARKRYDLARRAVETLNQTLPARLLVAWEVEHKDIPLYMSASDALVFTSMQEGSPNVVKEALACNLPVVSVAVGDVAERLAGVEGCELCSDDNAVTIAAALERVLKRAERIEGRAAVKDLDEALLTAKVINIYRTVMSGQTRTATHAADEARVAGRRVRGVRPEINS